MERDVIIGNGMKGWNGMEQQVEREVEWEIEREVKWEVEWVVEWVVEREEWNWNFILFYRLNNQLYLLRYRHILFT